MPFGTQSVVTVAVVARESRQSLSLLMGSRFTDTAFQARPVAVHRALPEWPPHLRPLAHPISPGQGPRIVIRASKPLLSTAESSFFRSRVLAVRDIPELERAAMTATIRQLYIQTRLGVIARPEMLEWGDGLARTFQQAEKMTIDAWHLLSVLTFEDIEQTRGIRR